MVTVHREGGFRIVIDPTRGATFSAPRRLLQGLRGASAAELAEVEVLGVGYGLHWESLDVDFSVPGLLAGWTNSGWGRRLSRPRSDGSCFA